jgi:predicted ATPase/DNA-binding winged helix-turn-helix (wHTH) protein
MDTGSHTPASVTFGRFEISPHRRQFFADGRPVQLGGRAFDVLMALIDAQGSVVSKRALMERVWPDRIVEENNLQLQISALRAAFGADRDLIRTVAGRGYQFTGETRTASAAPDRRRGSAAPDRETAVSRGNVPEPVSELIGRDDEIREILRFIQGHRLVTLTGPGGIGKTRLALAAARRLLPRFADGVWFAELAPLSEPTLVAAAVAAAVGLELAAGEASADHVACALVEKELLLFIDNCEHVIGGAGAMAEALLHANSAAHVVATSREPLKAEGEWIYRVPPLTVPAPDVTNEDDLLRHGSVQLFIKRAQAVEPHLVPDRHLAATVAAICRRLDGIPLAIELAASRTGALGIEQIAERLDDRFRLLAGGRRTALRRQQTMHATLEWSHALLTAPERVLLRRLAVFAGVFDLKATGEVAASPELATYEVVDALSDLVSKSLVDRNATGYRLLETIHAFALEKLVESGELEMLSRRHAEFHRTLFERAESEWEARAADEWMAEYGPKIDDLRAALDWAFSPSGNSSLGVALTVAAVPLWMELSLLQECRSRVKRALSASDSGASRDERQEMKLRVALATSITHSLGRVHELGAMWTRAFEIAEELSDRDYQLRSLRGLQIYYAGIDFRKSLEMARKFCLLAEQEQDKNNLLIGEAMVGASEHFLGNQISARVHIERMLANFSAPDHRSHSYAGRFQFFDQHVLPRIFLSRVLWLQGFPEQAMRTAEKAVEAAQVANNAILTCNAVCHASCPIALWMGDFGLADHHLKILLEHARTYTLPFWGELARMFEARLAVNRGDITGGLYLLRASFDKLGDSMPASDYVQFQSEIIDVLGRAGQIADGLTVAQQAIERCERTNERWLLAELLRVKGELMLHKESSAASAESIFREALDWARRQGALSWELRAATSLARLLRDQRRGAEAIAVIKSVYERFTEGFGTTDLANAKALIDDLRPVSRGEKERLASVRRTSRTRK